MLLFLLINYYDSDLGQDILRRGGSVVILLSFIFTYASTEQNSILMLKWGIRRWWKNSDGEDHSSMSSSPALLPEKIIFTSVICDRHPVNL